MITCNLTRINLCEYNFFLLNEDIANDLPLAGMYHWPQLFCYWPEDFESYPERWLVWTRDLWCHPQHLQRPFLFHLYRHHLHLHQSSLEFSFFYPCSCALSSAFEVGSCLHAFSSSLQHLWKRIKSVTILRAVVEQAISETYSMSSSSSPSFSPSRRPWSVRSCLNCALNLMTS